MKQFFSFLSITAFLALIFLSACSNQPTGSSNENIGEQAQLSLDKEFGGYETNDEQPAFGEVEMYDDFPEDVDVADSYTDDANVADALDLSSDAPSVKVYFLRITWGLLEGDSSATEIIDWSGSAEINKGTLVVLKQIRFEDGDFIHRPRESRQKVEFTSFTKPHFDGLLLAVIDNDTAQTDLEGTFTLNAGSYSKMLRFSELDSLNLLEPVGSAGHEVSIESRSRNATPFAGGFISGRWVKTRPHGGEFRGRWINSLGTSAGHLRGIWGINSFGNKVFKGKYISLNGEFRGLIEGQWGYQGDENGGIFKGRWVNRQLKTAGIVQGHFKSGRPNDGRGFFHGRYQVTHKDNVESDETS